jgi:protein-disulfide isomerase
MKKFLYIVPLLFILASCTNSQKIDVATPSSSTTITTNTSTAPVSSTPKEVRTIPTPTYGSGKHTIEIFADFQCPACQGFSKGIGLIMEDYAKQ